MRYYRENPDEPIRHDWLAGARAAGTMIYPALRLANTVTRYRSKEYPDARYLVTVMGRSVPFATPQGAATFIETHYPGVTFAWNIF